jgi:hypothetical protein
MKKYILILILLIATVFNAVACRFTVREIGFSILSQDIYTLAVIDEKADANDSFWKQFHDKNRDCNLRLEILNPVHDAEHPVVRNAKQSGIKFPATVLVAPDNRLYIFERNDILKIYSEILKSKLGLRMGSLFPDIFAIIFFVEGNDAQKNKTALIHINKDCADIENLMPNMPKNIKNGPVIIPVLADDFKSEKLLLWSLGIEEVPEEPLAFVLYGRGRIIGKALGFKQITEGGIYKYLSMIGADCECGLDRKWMLGHQIPLLWNMDLRQHLTNLVGFDVDNPMILAEMSRILTKETTADATGSVAFAPETIDLDKTFGKQPSGNDSAFAEQPENEPGRALIYSLIALFLIVSLVGVSILFRKSN